MKFNKNIFNSKIITLVFLILCGIYVMFDPGMTEVKFGYGYPGNVILGGVYTLICSILLVLSYKKLL